MTGITFPTLQQQLHSRGASLVTDVLLASYDNEACYTNARPNVLISVLQTAVEII